MGDNSCVIHRQHISDNCKMQAAYLSKLIYKRPLGTPAAGKVPKPFDTSWPEEIAKAEENWEEVQDFDEQERNGFVARLYKPKGYDFNAKNGDEMCWPTLVFRGTDFEDFHGLGLSVRIRVDNLADLIEESTSRFWVGFNEIMENAAKGTASRGTLFNVPLTPQERQARIRRDVELKKEKAREEARKRAIETTGEGTPERAEALAMAEHADSTFIDQTIILDAEFLKNRKNGYTRQEAIEEGFKPIKGISFPPIKGEIGGVLGGFAEIKVEILTRPQGRAGDWIANLLQGIGDIENSIQYQRAIAITKEVMRKHIDKPKGDKSCRVQKEATVDDLEHDLDHVL